MVLHPRAVETVLLVLLLPDLSTHVKELSYASGSSAKMHEAPWRKPCFQRHVWALTTFEAPSSLCHCGCLAFSISGWSCPFSAIARNISNRKGM